MQDLKLPDCFVFGVTDVFFGSKHSFTVHITELKLEFKTS